jgi:nucleoside-diphosphate-sugar epimerase
MSSPAATAGEKAPTELLGAPVIVTGATGYLGLALVRRLAAYRRQVHAIIRPTTSTTRLAEHLAADRLHRTGSDPEAISALVARVRPTAIFHVAAAGGISHSVGEVASLIDANLTLGTAVAEAATATGTAVVAAGSYWEYGDGAHGPANSLYAATKRSLDPVLDYYAAARGLRCVKLVLYDVYGPGDWRNRLLSQLVAAARGGSPIDLSEGLQVMEPLHVEDAADAFIHAAGMLVRGENLPPAVGVGSGERLTIRRLAERVERAVGARIEARWGARPYPEGQIFTPVELPRLPYWRPRHDLDAGLASLLADRS